MKSPEYDSQDKLLIITGMSGAGKSQAQNALEDIGYYCVDNVPPDLLVKFAELAYNAKGGPQKIALVVDVRSNLMFSQKDLEVEIEQLKKLTYDPKVLFLDCSDEVLSRRYKETRRTHPLGKSNHLSLLESIVNERSLLDSIQAQANYYIDTTLLSSRQLRERISSLFSQIGSDTLSITCTSFGFKYGIPQDADLVFDVRCLTNPFYIPHLKEQTGLDFPVEEYVLSFPEAVTLLDKLKDFLDFTVPLYRREGKTQLVISIGCTGGKHRSVVFAQNLANYLESKGNLVNVFHRDITKDK